MLGTWGQDAEAAEAAPQAGGQGAEPPWCGFQDRGEGGDPRLEGEGHLCPLRGRRCRAGGPAGQGQATVGSWGRAWGGGLGALVLGKLGRIWRLSWEGEPREAKASSFLALPPAPAPGRDGRDGKLASRVKLGLPCLPYPKPLPWGMSPLLTGLIREPWGQGVLRYMVFLCLQGGPAQHTLPTYQTQAWDVQIKLFDFGLLGCLSGPHPHPQPGDKLSSCRVSIESSGPGLVHLAWGRGALRPQDLPLLPKFLRGRIREFSLQEVPAQPVQGQSQESSPGAMGTCLRLGWGQVRGPCQAQCQAPLGIWVEASGGPRSAQAQKQPGFVGIQWEGGPCPA